MNTVPIRIRIQGFDEIFFFQNYTL
jgi:hypothetical protein